MKILSRPFVWARFRRTVFPLIKHREGSTPAPKKRGPNQLWPLWIVASASRSQEFQTLCRFRFHPEPLLGLNLHPRLDEFKTRLGKRLSEGRQVCNRLFGIPNQDAYRRSPQFSGVDSNDFPSMGRYSLQQFTIAFGFEDSLARGYYSRREEEDS
jgi:hypothetical protein